MIENDLRDLKSGMPLIWDLLVETHNAQLTQSSVLFSDYSLVRNEL